MADIGILWPEDLFDDESKENTPNRIERMMKEFEKWTSWELESGIFEMPGYNDLVIVKDIEFLSVCSHHCMPIYGKAHVAYLPDGYIVGLSKIPRTVRKFALRPQTQEKMTKQIADYLYEKIPNVKGVMVIVEAEHGCMRFRGVMSTGKMITSAIRGEIPKEEVLELIRTLK